eukprot:scaffold505_cov139-Skeletonema_menzelii.AAC.6
MSKEDLLGVFYCGSILLDGGGGNDEKLAKILLPQPQTRDISETSPNTTIISEWQNSRHTYHQSPPPIQEISSTFWRASRVKLHSPWVTLHFFTVSNNEHNIQREPPIVYRPLPQIYTIHAITIQSSHITLRKY